MESQQEEVTGSHNYQLGGGGPGVSDLHASAVNPCTRLQPFLRDDPGALLWPRELAAEVDQNSGVLPLDFGLSEPAEGLWGRAAERVH